MSASTTRSGCAGASTSPATGSRCIRSPAAPARDGLKLASNGLSIHSTRRDFAMTDLHLPLSRRQVLRAAAGSAATLALPAFAAYPEKPITIVVTFAAGGASDIVA